MARSMPLLLLLQAAALSGSARAFRHTVELDVNDIKQGSLLSSQNSTDISAVHEVEPLSKRSSHETLPSLPKGIKHGTHLEQEPLTQWHIKGMEGKFSLEQVQQTVQAGKVTLAVRMDMKEVAKMTGEADAPTDEVRVGDAVSYEGVVGTIAEILSDGAIMVDIPNLGTRKAAPGQWQLESAEESCKDTSERCKRLAAENCHTDRYGAWMAENCPESCGMCDVAEDNVATPTNGLKEWDGCHRWWNNCPKDETGVKMECSKKCSIKAWTTYRKPEPHGGGCYIEKHYYDKKFTCCHRKHETKWACKRSSTECDSEYSHSVYKC